MVRFSTLFLLGSFLGATGLAQQAPAPPSQQQAPAPGSPSAVRPQPVIPSSAPHAADIRAARHVANMWNMLLDTHKYDDAYNQLGQAARSQITPEKWKDETKKTVGHLGKLLSRTMQNADYSTTVTGAPTGQYVVLQYLNTYANHRSVLETMVLAKNNGSWQVVGVSLR